METQETKAKTEKSTEEKSKTTKTQETKTQEKEQKTKEEEDTKPEYSWVQMKTGKNIKLEMKKTRRGMCACSYTKSGRKLGQSYDYKSMKELEDSIEKAKKDDKDHEMLRI